MAAKYVSVSEQDWLSQGTPRVFLVLSIPSTAQQLMSPWPGQAFGDTFLQPSYNLNVMDFLRLMQCFLLWKIYISMNLSNHSLNPHHNLKSIASCGKELPKLSVLSEETCLFVSVEPIALVFILRHLLDRKRQYSALSSLAYWRLLRFFFLFLCNIFERGTAVHNSRHRCIMHTFA